MDLTKLLQALAFVPSVITAVERLFAGRSGSEKRDAAISFVETAISLGDAVAAHHIADEAKFKAGMTEIIDGAVACLNASVWAKKSS